MRIFILILILSLTSGCSITPQSPEQLINEKPIYSEENYILYNKIKSILPTIDTTSILPENSVDVGKINSCIWKKEQYNWWWEFIYRNSSKFISRK